MPNYYWVGGSTSGPSAYQSQVTLGGGSGSTGTTNYTWLNAFDWNNPYNWRIKSGSIYAIKYTVANECPGPLDNAIFASSEIDGITGFKLPSSALPCLWGGASSSGNTTSWIGAGTSGAVQNFTSQYQGAINSVQIGSSGGYAATQYPFKFIGLPNGNLESAYSASVWSPFGELEDKGIYPYSLSLGYTGETWQTLISGVLATGGVKTRYDSLSIRTDNFSTIPQMPETTYFGHLAAVSGDENQGSINVTLLKNMRQIPPSSASGATLTIESTNVNAKGPASYTIRGYSQNLTRIVNTNVLNLQDPYVKYAARNHLLINGCTVGYLDFKGSGIMFDSTSNIAESYLTLTKNHTVQLHNKFDRVAVLSEIQPGGTYAGGNSGEEISLDISYMTDDEGGLTAVQGTAPSNLNWNITGIIIGSDGITFEANNVIARAFTPDCRFAIKFAGSANINNMEILKTEVSAIDNIPMDANATINIGTLAMSSGCTMNFAKVPSFNNWNFGKQVGYEIQGGIVFQTEDSVVKGSNGVRLYNDQLIVNGALRKDGASKRSALSTATTADSVAFI